ncbi:hypothetical protein LTR78_006875 [Recurvomyces mirabilis]|uniref:F-box domain-containing protein n=1 Tax=Recurvomyces mirabilis TaxID=574656 RepID=A0AAE1BZK6_9PEZI|nr:hypothetical protein LTR78_006875 [Recurvomyces mirabilis]KAK5153135.1 hypothetical protein LTS14_007779 [Recurvomyces mirabilis]
MSALLPTTKSMTTTFESATMATPASTTTAVHEVFHAAELLEQILLHLPFKWLLLSQRTSKSFQAAMATSPALRRESYLEASTSKAQPELAPFFVDYENITDAHWSASPGFDYTKTDPVAFPNRPLKTFRISGQNLGMSYAKGSWRNMLVTQPPPQELKSLRWSFTKEGYNDEEIIVDRREEGIRWSDVLKAAARVGCDDRGVDIWSFSGAPLGREIRASTVA